MKDPMLADALRLLRSYHGMSQTELAVQLKVSRSYLCEIEAGRKQPSLDLLRAYADYFRTPLSAILLFSESVESGPMAEKARKATTTAAVKLLDWLESRGNRGGVAA